MNFEMWKLKIDQDLWDAVDENVQRPIDLALATKYDVMDRKAKCLIRLYLADSILINFHEEPTSNALWRNLGEIYQAKSLVDKIFLRKKLYSTRIEGGWISKHLETFSMLVNQLTLVGVKMDEEERCQTLLCSLPDSWDSLVMAIGSTFVILKMEVIVGSLLSKEMRRKVSLNTKEALSVRGRQK